jgi:hypothetical protein
MPLFLLLEAGVYIYENPPSPWGGGGRYQRMSFGRKILKGKEKKGGKSKRKRKKGERKRENVKLKGKINAK